MSISSIFIFILLVFLTRNVSAQTCNTGDGNGDGKVDGFDYVIWWQKFNQNVYGPQNGDYNCSGRVDGFDYVIWWQNFGKPVGGTPTPTGIVYSCGNGICGAGESCSTCPGDCPGVCNLSHRVICGAQKEGLDPNRFNLNFTNKWLPFPVGLVNELTDGSFTVKVSALNQTEVVNGVTTRVVEEREWQGTNLIEVSRNYFAQTPDGTVCYFGEDVRDGNGNPLGGSWRADQPNAWAGIMMPANPTVGMTWLIEDAAAYGAYENALLQSIGGTWNTRWGTVQNAMYIIEDNGASHKRYAKCIGMIFDDGIDLKSTTQAGECP